MRPPIDDRNDSNRYLFIRPPGEGSPGIAALEPMKHPTRVTIDSPHVESPRRRDSQGESPRRLWHAGPIVVLSILLAWGIAAAPAHAQEVSDAARVRALEERVAALEARMGELLDALRAAEGGDAAELRRRIDLLAAELEKLRMGEAAADRPLTSVHGLGPAASRVYGVTRGVSIGGYGEALYEDFSARNDDGDPSGKTDRLDFLRAVLYFGYKLSDRIVFNSELEFEHGSTEEEGSVSVEFAYLDFLMSPAFNVRAGMVLVPSGFVNELHEPPIYLGARRPEVDRRIIPTTWRENGIGLFGDAGPFSYRGYILAGFDSEGFDASTALREGRQAGSESDAEDLAIAARVDYTGVPGLLVGGFYYQGGSDQGRETPTALDPNGFATATAPLDATVSLYDFHAEYRARGVDLRAVYAAGSVDDAAAVNEANGLDGGDSVGEDFRGWYAQAGYDLLSHRSEATEQALIPYVRFESMDTQSSVPGDAPLNPAASPFASNPANDLTVLTYGVAWKPIFNVSIKLDYSDFKNDADTGVDQLSLALGYLF